MADAYRLKPIEWTYRNDPNLGRVATGSCLLGMLAVTRHATGGWCWWYWVDEYDEGSADCDGLEDGIAKAEEWYLSRLLPWIEPVTEGHADG